jgi:hypothetical protein
MKFTPNTVESRTIAADVTPMKLPSAEDLRKKLHVVLSACKDDDSVTNSATSRIIMSVQQLRLKCLPDVEIESEVQRNLAMGYAAYLSLRDSLGLDQAAAARIAAGFIQLMASGKVNITTSGVFIPDLIKAQFIKDTMVLLLKDIDQVVESIDRAHNEQVNAYDPHIKDSKKYKTATEISSLYQKIIESDNKSYINFNRKR